MPELLGQLCAQVARDEHALHGVRSDGIGRDRPVAEPDDEHGRLRHQRQGGAQELRKGLRGVFKGIVRAAQQRGEVERVVPPDWFT